AGRGDAVVPGDVSRHVPAAGGFAGACLADVLHPRQRRAVTEGVQGRHGVVVHVPAAVVEDLGDGVVGDVPVAVFQAHLLPDRLVDAGDGAAHRVAVVVELADGVGQGQAVPEYRVGLLAAAVVPVEDRPALLTRRRPAARSAVHQAGQVGV